MVEDLSKQYDRMGNDYISGKKQFFGQIEDGAAKYILENLPSLSGKTILDLGCGDGGDILRLQELGATDIYGIDASKFMVEKAKERVAVPEHITVANIEKTGLKGELFDLVISRYALHYLESFGNLYKEVSRILRPGGQFSFVVPHPFRDLALQTKKIYGEQEVLEVKLYDGQVVIRYPSHTFQDYFSSDFIENFELINFSEVSQSDEFENGKYILPGFIGVTAIKK